jgi:Spx/MgsR family transcriptional regulator
MVDPQVTKSADFYQKPSCTTCRNAVADLEARGVALRKHDLAKELPSRELLSRLIDEQGMDVVVNAKSRAFKDRRLELSALTREQAIDLILEEPNLMKRPLLLSGSRAIFGFRPDDYRELFG